MIDETFFATHPYALVKEEKHRKLSEYLRQLTEHHISRCEPYQKIITALQFEPRKGLSYYDLPFLPVRMFKEYDLVSAEQSDIVKIMKSSGTTGQQQSRIYLDKLTAASQIKVLSKIVTSFVGPGRHPMLILDSAAVLKDRTMLSARGAGILGFSMFASDRAYAFDENMNLDVKAIQEFLAKHAGKELMLFGFTFMVWQHFYLELRKSGFRPDLSHGVLIHGGGWKKLVSQSVSTSQFKAALFDVSRLKRVHDYYGMVEQTGSIYVECEAGHLHASIFSDVVIRRPKDLSVASVGEPGIIQVLSSLPCSYPGHSLLTEDEGILLGEDDCSCGRMGKYFTVLGRLKNAEVRGCSDTYAISEG